MAPPGSSDIWQRPRCGLISVLKVFATAVSPHLIFLYGTAGSRPICIRPNRERTGRIDVARCGGRSKSFARFPNPSLTTIKLSVKYISDRFESNRHVPRAVATLSDDLSVIFWTKLRSDVNSNVSVANLYSATYRPGTSPSLTFLLQPATRTTHSAAEQTRKRFGFIFGFCLADRLGPTDRLMDSPKRQGE